MIGEFDDGRLMKTLGCEGRGVFMSASVLEAEITVERG
jgi:LysR family transcriptional activator of nhaA